MNLFAEIDRVTELLYPKVYGSKESGDVRKSETPQGGVGPQMPREGSIPSATPITYADVPLGEEFYDEWDNLWEKREKYAISWVEGHPIETMEFKPDDVVRRK